MGATGHLPVLLEETLRFLDCQPGRIYVDGTVGSGGHARAILNKSAPSGRLIGLDWDGEAIERARLTLAPFGERIELIKDNFKNLEAILKRLSLAAVDGILLDLGVSSEQLENGKRGFSFLKDGPLDMRMSQEEKITARDLLQRLSLKEINEILLKFGEERWARRIARAVIQRRKTKPFNTTLELVETIRRSIPYCSGRRHPATRTFQALRLAVNKELENLQNFLGQCPGWLNTRGRLVVISFHSLEDRLVKNHFREWARGKKDSPFCFRLLTPKPVIPSAAEVRATPQSRSAKLRAIEKLSRNS